MKHKHDAKVIVRVVSGIFFLGLFLSLANNSYAEDLSLLDKMVSPIANPINFEDPRITTELRPFYVHHQLNDDFVTDGGEVNAWAAQVRIAITEDLAFIANKDGYLRLQADKVLNDEAGALNLEGGLKYSVYKDEEKGEIISLGLKYQVASGDPDIFQGQGDGLIIPFVSAAKHLAGVNLMGSSQLRVAIDNDDSSFWDLSLHADYPLGKFYPSFEMNLFHVYNGGNRHVLPGEGADVLNIGASGADGDTTVNLAVGMRYRACKYTDLGIAFEFPVTDEKDVFGERVIVDVVIKLPNWTLL